MYQDAKFVTPFDAAKTKVVNKCFTLAKSDGQIRFVADLRNCNMFITAPKFALPSIYSVLLEPATWMMKFDLSNAFMHFDIHDELKPYCCFKDDKGKMMTWNKLPWGSSISPFVCQTIMEPVLHLVRQKYKVQAHIFYDDMVILSVDKERTRLAGRYLVELLNKLDMDINYEKSDKEPTTKIEWLGVDVETDLTNPSNISISNT